MNLTQLRRIVKPNVIIAKHIEDTYLATYVEKNKDEFRLAQAKTTDALHDTLKNMGYLK